MITTATGTAPVRDKRRAWFPHTELLILVIALVPRIGFVLANQGGYQGSFEYDPAVYFASAVALLHGRLPYRNFLLLHPPGSAIALLPFAGLGEVTGDHIGFEAAQLGFAVLGAVNAALVALIARRLGYGLRAALARGLFYALWPGAANAEYASRLEPLGNSCLLMGLLAYTVSERSPHRRWPMLCGLGFGLAVTVKIWWIAPLAVLLGWHLAGERRRRLALTASGAAGGMVLVVAPFFLAAPRAMWRMVVLDQILRPRRTGPMRERLVDLSGLGQVHRVPFAQQLPIVIVTATIGALACVAAFRAPKGPLFVGLTVVNFVVLLRSPSYFPYYNDFLAPAAALTLAAAARRRAESPARSTAGSRRRTLAVAFGAVVVIVAGGAVAYGDVALPRRVIKPYPVRALSPGVRGARCVMSDSPMPLILLDVLSRNLRDGCPVWVDVTGHIYDRYAPPVGVSRRHYPRWQRALAAYLFSGDRVTLFRGAYTGIGPALNRRYASLPVLSTGAGFSVRLNHPRRPPASVQP